MHIYSVAVPMEKKAKRGSKGKNSVVWKIEFVCVCICKGKGVGWGGNE